MNKGNGCFKCGSLDHMAKDCTGDPTNRQQGSKYILKDGNTQHGGDDNSRYEMVFDGDELESPKGNKRERYNEPEKSNRREAYLDKQERDGIKDSQHLRSHRDRSKEFREDDKHRGDRASTHNGKYRGNRASDEGNFRRKAYGGSDRDRRQDMRYEKRHRDDDSHGDNRYRRKYEERRADDVGRRDRRDERDSMRRKGGNEVSRN